MSSKKKREGLIKQMVKIAKSHITDIMSNIKEEAVMNAEDKHNVELKIIKPSLKKIKNDLLEWNKNRKEQNKINREEAKTIIIEAAKQIKSGVLNTSDEFGSDEFDFDEDFFKDFDFDDFDDEEEEDMIGNESVNPYFGAEATAANMIILSILSNTRDVRIENLLANDRPTLNNLLGIRDETTIEIVSEVIDTNTEEIATELEDVSDATISEIHEMIDDKLTSNDLAVAINRPEIVNKLGMENTDLTEVVTAYKYQDIIKQDVLKVVEDLYLEYDLVEQNKEIMEKLSVVTRYVTNNEYDGLDIFIKNNPILNSINQAYDYIEKYKIISMYQVFMTVLTNPDNEYVELINSAVRSLTEKLHRELGNTLD